MEMDVQDHTSSSHFERTSFSAPLDGPGSRVRSSLRLQYEAQVSVIQGQIGNLEKIRQDLGLSQRKMSQLLMVDPSAWTRWTRDGESAPPSVWRALQWYFIVREKIPGLTPSYFLGNSGLGKDSTAEGLRQTQRQYQILEEKWRRLESETQKLRRWNRVWFGIAASGVIFFLLSRLFPL